MQTKNIVVSCIIIILLNKVSHALLLDIQKKYKLSQRSSTIAECKLNENKNISIYASKVFNKALFSEYMFSTSVDDFLEDCIQKCCLNAACEGISFSKLGCYGYPSHTFKVIDTSHEDEFYGLELNERKASRDFNRLKRSRRSSNFKKPTPCTVGLLNCNENEYCKTINSRRRHGVCECKEGYKRNREGTCISGSGDPSFTTSSSIDETLSNNVQSTTDKSLEATTDSHTFTSSEIPNQVTESTSSLSGGKEVEPIKKLVVNIYNKTITLQEGMTRYKDWVTLSAYALGETGSKYKFNWNLVDKPDSKEEGSIRDMNTQTISLSDLVAGVYIFKVSVNGTNAYGETTGNVTVLPAKHVNKPPIAVIVPPSQIVKLPNSGVILDGSGSSDDKKIVSLHWELAMGPLGYKLEEQTGPTLQMTDLIPGNYTVMLKVKDEEGLEGNTTASVVIVKETDYPPTANAGGDKIIYLPQSEITLNGNMSTDDHEIVEWEWTKGPEDSGNAVDMQDTRTPYLHLSNLEEGHYHFILKVVDTAHQASNSSAHVYVHSSSDNILKANAGKDKTIVIPNTTVTLDGSLSTGVSSQTMFLWSQLSGPSQASFSSANKLQTNASELTLGKYDFQLTIWNREGKTQNSSSNVSITVIQDVNAPPVANAGGDFSVTLPVSVVIVSGTESSDDVGISKWLWQRDAASLAAGTIIKQSDKSSVLLITNVVPGRYVWNLTVWDDQGSSSTDSVSIIVKEGPNYLNEVEILVGVSIENLSVRQLNILLQKLQLLLHNSTSDISFTLLDIKGRPMSGEVSLTVLGKRNGKVIKGTTLVHELKEKTVTHYRDKILNLPILSVDTVICQNNCSEHGECIQATRECRCHSWWMESFVKRHFGEAIPNCDWSVVYVFVGIIGMCVFSGAFCWALYLFTVKKVRGIRQRKSKPPHYTLLDGFDDTVKVQARLQGSLLDSGSETDSETEILFESRNSKQRNDKHKNGLMKSHKLRT